jgi:hypothetical protein
LKVRSRQLATAGEKDLAACHRTAAGWLPPQLLFGKVSQFRQYPCLLELFELADI